jgi:hypothetical protein
VIFYAAGKLVEGILNIAGFFEPIIRPSGNNVVTQVGERLTEPVREMVLAAPVHGRQSQVEPVR